MKLLHLADVHLGAGYAGFGDLASSRSRQVLDAFRQLPDTAEREKVSAALIAGDLFDGPHASRAIVAAVRDTLRRFLDLGVPVFMVPGNHDSTTLRDNPYHELARSSNTLLVTEPGGGDAVGSPRGGARDGHGVATGSPGPGPPAHAYILASSRFGDPVRVETRDGPLCVYGVAYDPAESDDPLAGFRRSAHNGSHVVLIHASIHSASHWEGSPSSLSATPDALARLDADYIALGDHHRPTLPGELPGTAACYAGSFAACNLTETGPRGFLLVTVGPGVPPRAEHRDAGVMPVVSVALDVSSLPDEVRVAEAVGQRLSGPAVPVVRLVGEPSFPLDAAAVRTELVERFGHAHVTDRTRFYASDRLNELAALDTVAGHVVRLGRERIEASDREEAREIARQALRTALRALEVE